MQPFYLRVNGRRAESPGDKEDLLPLKRLHIFVHKLGGTAERSYKILKTVSCFQMTHHLGSRSHHLENDGDGSLFHVIIADGQGNPLPGFVDLYDDKLSRLA